MSNDFVASTIRRMNLRLLVISLLGLLLVFAGLLLSWRYLYNFFLGPFDISRGELLALQDAGSRTQYYVTVTGDDHADTGYSYVSTTDSGKETTEHYYHALFLDDRLLLVKSPLEEIGDQVTGALVKLPSDVQNEVIGELEIEVPEIKGAFLPMMLDAMNFRTGGYFGLGAAGLFGLLSLFGGGLAAYRFTTPQAHPALKKLTNYGALESVTGEIDIEMAAPLQMVGKKITFTRRWLVSTLAGLDAMPYRDILWAYKQVTQHRTNGIPTGKAYAALVHDRHGRQISLTGKEDQVNQILETLVSQNPGMVSGFSDELVKMWKNERSRFVAAVDARRARPSQ